MRNRSTSTSSSADARESHAADDDERFFVGLRLMRRHPADARGLAALRSSPSRASVDAGLLESADGVLRLTDRGVLLSNEVFQEFLTA